MKARKVIALFVVVGTLAAAGTAFAGGYKKFKGCMCEGCNGQKFNQPMPSAPHMMQGQQPMPPAPHTMQPQPGPHANMQHRPAPFAKPEYSPFMNFYRSFAQHFQPKHRPDNNRTYSKPVKFSPNMPDEIRAKVTDAAKLRIDLDNVMTKKPVDKAKAVEIYTNISKLESEIRVWRFSQKLDRLEKAAAARNHGKPEAPQEPAPQPEPEQQAN